MTTAQLIQNNKGLIKNTCKGIVNATNHLPSVYPMVSYMDLIKMNLMPKLKAWIKTKVTDHSVVDKIATDLINLAFSEMVRNKHITISIEKNKSVLTLVYLNQSSTVEPETIKEVEPPVDLFKEKVPEVKNEPKKFIPRIENHLTFKDLLKVPDVVSFMTLN